MIVVLILAWLAPGRAEENAPGKSIRVPRATWFSGFLHLADAVVVGKVTGVTAEVSPSDPRAKVYQFSLEVKGVGGDCPELKTVRTIQSENGHEVTVGAWVMMLIAYYEKKPDLATGSRALDLLAGPDDSLARLFLAKGTAFQDYSEGEMLLLKRRMPADYEYIVARREFLRNQGRQGE